jgi:hypothetical protein
MDPAGVCLVSLNAYHRIYPDSFFRRTLKKEDLEHARNSLVFLGFSKLHMLAKESKHYFIILKLIEQDVEGVCEMLLTEKTERLREKFEKIKNETKNEVLEKFKKYFAEEERKI